MLTKTDLQSFLQCPRKLWLEHKRSELIPPNAPTIDRRIVDGNIVGQEARKQFASDFILPPLPANEAAAAEKARALLAECPGKAVTEVPMYHAGLYARADALVPDGDRYALRETKASTFPLKNDKVTPAPTKDYHLSDLAIQAWVMQESGLPMKRAELNLLDNQWRYPGNADYSGLFRQLDVTTEVQSRSKKVPQWLADAEKILASEMPIISTGKHCMDPYACYFKSFCEPIDPPRPEHPLDLLPDSAGKKLAAKLLEKGYTSLLDPSPDELIGAQAELYKRIQQAHRTGSAVLEPGTEKIMGEFPYPRYYFDFEGIDFPVPRWAGVRPYEQIPFQWSCHIERSRGVFEHAEFLDLTGDDPSLPCIEKIREVINPEDSGPIFVYYATYEKSRLKGLAERYPEHSALLEKYVNRLVDLGVLIKENFYDPAMHGSFSIKKVLPVIAPDLNYQDLEEVQEGTGAQVAYLYAVLHPDTTPERKSDLARKLRIYCRQDTWAMVEVAYFLAKAGRPVRPAEM